MHSLVTLNLFINFTTHTNGFIIDTAPSLIIMFLCAYGMCPSICHVIPPPPPLSSHVQPLKAAQTAITIIPIHNLIFGGSLVWRLLGQVHLAVSYIGIS